VGFLVDKAVLGQVFSEYLGFLTNQTTDCSTLIIVHRPGLAQYAKWWPM
jgi:hypothetical protein